MGLLQRLGFSGRKQKKLKENGLAITAVIKDIAVNNSVTINGRNPRRLICEGTLPTGESRYFESGNVSPLIHPDVIGRTINVYLDPEDYTNYLVDAEAYK